MTATPIEAQWPVLRRAARTVVVVDVVESVRLIEQDEEGTVRRWQAFVGEVVTRLLPKYGGRLVKSLGDGLMVEFGAVPPAIQCAIDMQSTIAKANQGRATEQWLCLRVGAHAADVIVDDLDIYGSGVNLAARLTTLAGPGEIVVSADVRDLLAPGLDGDIEDLGECRVKHLQKPVRAYRVGAVGPKPIIGPPTGAAASLQPTIAVLPFDCLSAGAGVEVLGDVVADAVIAQLSTAAMTRVISRLSSSLLRGRRATPGEVRATLGATYVLNGSYHLAGSRVVVSAELADARSAEVIWAERITVPMLDPLQADSELVHRIHVGVHTAVMNCEMRRASTLPLPTLESCSLLIGAIALMHRASHTDFEPARLMLEHLIERAPRSPIPRAWLAKWYVLGVTRGWMDDSAVNAKQAIEQTRRALDVDPNCSLLRWRWRASCTATWTRTWTRPASATTTRWRPIRMNRSRGCSAASCTRSRAKARPR